MALISKNFGAFEVKGPRPVGIQQKKREESFYSAEKAQLLSQGCLLPLGVGAKSKPGGAQFGSRARHPHWAPTSAASTGLLSSGARLGC